MRREETFKDLDWLFEEIPPVNEISHKEIATCLGGKGFSRLFSEMMRWVTRGIEEGIIVCANPGLTLSCHRPERVEPDAIKVGEVTLLRRGLVPLLIVHAHPIDDLSSYVPSLEDLEDPGEVVSVGAGGKRLGWFRRLIAEAVIVASHPPQVWLWQVPERRVLYQVIKDYKMFFDSLSAGGFTHKEIKELEDALRSSGLFLVRKEITGNLPAEFTHLFLTSGVKLGLSKPFILRL